MCAKLLRIYASHYADGTFNSLFLFMEKLLENKIHSAVDNVRGAGGIGASDKFFTKVRACGLSDDQLLRLCEKYGLQAKLWRQKFCGLLPEVCKRRLYEKKRFRTIFEFGLILGGLSEHQVRLVLNLDKRFEEMPHLHSLLVEGKVSVNKLARVVSVANTENEEFLSHQVRNLSQKALETLVRDMQIRNGIALNNELVDIQFQRHGMKSLFHVPENFLRSIDEKNIALGSEMQTGDAVQISGATDVRQNGFLKSLNNNKSLRAQTFGIDNNSHKEANSLSVDKSINSSNSINNLKCTDATSGKFLGKNVDVMSDNTTREHEPYNVDVQIKFMALVPKLDQKIKARILELSEKGIDVNSVLAVILEEREQDILQRKNEIVESKIGSKNIVDARVSEAGGKDGKSQTASRYIPVNTRRVLQLEHGTKCSIATCSKMAEQIHHSQRFGLMKNSAPMAAHDPRYLAPMCKEHHQIAHSIDVKFGEVRKKIVQRE